MNIYCHSVLYIVYVYSINLLYCFSDSPLLKNQSTSCHAETGIIAPYISPCFFLITSMSCCVNNSNMRLTWVCSAPTWVADQFNCLTHALTTFHSLSVILRTQYCLPPLQTKSDYGSWRETAYSSVRVRKCVCACVRVCACVCV